MISWFHDLLDFCFYADKVFAKATREGILSTQRIMITQKESTRYETPRSKWLGIMLNNRKEIGQRNESSCIFIIWKYLLWNAFFFWFFFRWCFLYCLRTPIPFTLFQARATFFLRIFWELVHPAFALEDHANNFPSNRPDKDIARGEEIKSDNFPP